MNILPHDPNLIVPADGILDPELSNGLPARSAREAMLDYLRECGFVSDDVIRTDDLLTDLLHFLHSRGEDPFAGIEKARDYFEAEVMYVAFLNGLLEGNAFNLAKVEAWWVERVRDFFESSPLKLRVDTGSSLKACLTTIFDEAKRRQSENRGSTVLGAVMQHLVGAKLEVLYPDQEIRHSGYSVADSPTGRSGDFQLGDCVIHVTTAPGKLLLQKCSDNLDRGLRPLIVSTHAGAALADTLADEEGLSKRIEVLDITQFLVANMLEWTGFDGSQRRDTFEGLISRYNAIIDECETDPSLRIELA